MNKHILWDAQVCFLISTKLNNKKVYTIYNLSEIFLSPHKTAPEITIFKQIALWMTKNIFWEAHGFISKTIEKLIFKRSLKICTTYFWRRGKTRPEKLNFKIDCCSLDDYKYVLGGTRFCFKNFQKLNL